MEHVMNERCPCNPTVKLEQGPQGDQWIYIHRREDPSQELHPLR